MLKRFRILLIIVLGLFFYSILLSSAVRNIYLSQDGGAGRFGIFVQPLKMMAELPSLIKKYAKAPEFYVNNSKAGDGFTYFGISKGGQRYPKLLLSYKDAPFQQHFDLVDLNTGTTIKKWRPNDRELFEKAYNDLNPRKPAKGSDLYFMHPYMTGDSSLIFSAQLTSMLAKIGQNGDLIWLKNNKIYHHTIEGDAEGRIYVCSQPFESGNYGFLPDNDSHSRNILQDDHITILDELSGEELYSKSVIEILLENGYKDIILDKGQIISDPIHLNDIQPALYSTEYWEKGDLLVSCRNLSTVFLFRPSTNKIMWLKRGPWYNQHDVDFVGNNRISVFGNDVIREESAIDPKLTSENLYFSKDNSHNEIYVYDFESDSISHPYHQLMEIENIRTSTSGRSEILTNGDVFVEETANGRIIIGDSITKKMEYVKRLDKDHISSLFWSRIIN